MDVPVNDDRCYHIPMSEGQSMCACKDYQMTLELTIELLCKRVVDLEAQCFRAKPRVIIGPGHQMTVPNQVPSKRPDPTGPVAD